MTIEHRRLLIWALAAGGAIRVVLAFGFYGQPFDIALFQATADQLSAGPRLEVYEATRWPYPPLFFSWLLIAETIDDATPLPFHGLVQMPQIAADLAIALLVVHILGLRGAASATRLGAGALVALGPVFFTISGYHGQTDAAATLPAVAALVLWLRGGPNRAVTAGLLLGAGAAIKAPPVFLLLALLPSARNRREGLVLAGCTLAVPLLLLAPWLINDLGGTVERLRANRGIPGLGGPSLLVQPELAQAWLGRGQGASMHALNELLYDLQNLIVLAGALAGGAVAWRLRLDPVRAAALVFLAVYAANPAFAWQYLVWGVPFLLAAGYVRETAILQGVAAVGLFFAYGRPTYDLPTEVLYVPAAVGTWALLAYGLVRTLRALRARPAPV